MSINYGQLSNLTNGMSLTSELTKRKILYISYDGLMEPLGQSQVLNYLKGLSTDYQMFVISYEKKEDYLDLKKKKLLKEIVSEKNINWIALRYHSNYRVLSTIYDVLLGFIVSFFLITFNRIQLIHIRSTIPGLIAQLLNIFLNFKLIFDMRGFWSDEKADRGGWSREGMLYKFFNSLETKLIQNSDSVITLTDNAIELILSKNPLFKREKFVKITTCSDLDVFKKREEIIENKKFFTLGHVGSVDTAYDIEPILNLYKRLSTKYDFFKLLFLNKGSHNYINHQLERLNISREGIEVIDVDFNQIPEYFKKIDFGCFYAKPNLSIKASMPTKLGEFLASGIPVLCNPLNEDITQLITKNNIGIISDFDSSLNLESIQKNLLDLSNSKDIRDKCRRVAESNFSLETGIKEYKLIYHSLLEKDLI